MPKEDFTEREIRKIRQLLMYLMKLRDESRFIEMREKLDEVAADNEFPEFADLLNAEMKTFEALLLNMKPNAVVLELYFQLMEIEAGIEEDGAKKNELYKKALKLGLYSQELDRTFLPYRNEMLERIRNKLS